MTLPTRACHTLIATMLTPELSGKNEGEDFADAFAGALLYSKACAEQAYRAATQQSTVDRAIKVLLKQADAHMISLNTIFQQVQRYAKASNLKLLPIEEKSIHVLRNSLRGSLVSENMFDPMPPSPQRYIAACEKTFQTSFFQALKRMIHNSGTGASYVQQVLDTSLQDAMGLYEELRR